MGTLSNAIEHKLADRSPEEADPPCRNPSSHANVSEVVSSSCYRYRSVNISTQDLGQEEGPSCPFPLIEPSSSDLSTDSDPRDFEIFRLQRELSHASLTWIFKSLNSIRTQILRPSVIVRTSIFICQFCIVEVGGKDVVEGPNPGKFSSCQSLCYSFLTNHFLFLCVV